MRVLLDLLTAPVSVLYWTRPGDFVGVIGVPLDSAIMAGLPVPKPGIVENTDCRLLLFGDILLPSAGLQLSTTRVPAGRVAQALSPCARIPRYTTIGRAAVDNAPSWSDAGEHPSAHGGDEHSGARQALHR